MRTSRPARRSARILALFTTIALIAAMTPVMPVAAVSDPIPGDTWYVDASATSEGSGTVADPFRSITSALATATAGDSIEVAPGTYGEYEEFPLRSTSTSLTVYSTGGSAQTIIDGDGTEGPLFYLVDVKLSMSGFTVTGAVAPEIDTAPPVAGGGMSIHASEVQLEDMVITGNVARQGAGIYASESVVTLGECMVSDNGEHSPAPDVEPLFDIPDGLKTGTYSGGGIYAYYSNVLMADSEVTGNMADRSGAGIEAYGSVLIGIESLIAENVLSGIGVVGDAGVSSWDPGAVSVAREEDQMDGGGVHSYESVLAFGGSTFTANVGEYAAVAAEYSMLLFEECDVSGHEGFAAVGYRSVIGIPGEQALGTGGGHDITGARATSIDDLLDDALSGSVGVAQSIPSLPYAFIWDTLFTGNTCETVFMTDGGLMDMENCIFTGNDVAFPTVGLKNTFADIVCTTMYDNGSLWGVWSEGMFADVYVWSSIIWDAGEDTGPVAPTEMAPSIVYGGDLGLLYNDLKSGVEFMGELEPNALMADEGNISEDPRFMDRDNGDLRLALGSPCVDAGYPDSSPDWDFAGNDRPQDGDEDGEAIADMGALEYVPGGRLGGADRYATAVLAVEQNFSYANIVVIATGERFADALSASALCGLYEAPLLITPPDELDGSVADEIERLGASEAIIVGGVNAVHPAVADALEDLGLEVSRIGGVDRYETSALIARHVIEAIDFDGRVFLARGDNFADALAVSPVAYAHNIPVLLVRSDRLPSPVVEVLYDYDVDTAAVLGGSAAVSTQVEVGTQMTLGVLTERIGGADRYETAALISQWAYDNSLASFETVGMTTGLNFPDALCGGAGIGVRGGVLLLTPPTELCEPATDALTAHDDEVMAVQFFGGVNALSEDVKDAVYALLGW